MITHSWWSKQRFTLICLLRGQQCQWRAWYEIYEISLEQNIFSFESFGMSGNDFVVGLFMTFRKKWKKLFYAHYWTLLVEKLNKLVSVKIVFKRVCAHGWRNTQLPWYIFVRGEGGGEKEEEKAEGLKENSVKVSAPTLHSSMVCETVENGKLKRLVSAPPDLTEETGEQETEGRITNNWGSRRITGKKEQHIRVEVKRSCIQWVN